MITRWQYSKYYNVNLDPMISPNSNIRSYQAEINYDTVPKNNNTSKGSKPCQVLIIGVQPNLSGEPVDFYISYSGETIHFHQEAVQLVLNNEGALACSANNKTRICAILDNLAYYYGSNSDRGHENGAKYASLAVKTFWDNNKTHEYGSSWKDIVENEKENRGWTDKQKLDCWRLVACANAKYARNYGNSYQNVFKLRYNGDSNLLNYYVYNCEGDNTGRYKCPEGVLTWKDTLCKGMGSYYYEEINMSREAFDTAVKNGKYIYPGTYIFTTNKGHIGIYLFAYKDSSGNTISLIFDTTGSKDQNGSIAQTYDSNLGEYRVDYRKAFPYIQKQKQLTVKALAFPFVVDARFQ